jgi:hypothetical protein
MRPPGAPDKDAGPSDSSDRSGNLRESPEGGLSEAFQRDLDAARRALDRLVERLRRWLRGPLTERPGGTVASTELVGRLQQGVLKEHDLVLAPLLDRLDAIGTRLIRGETIPLPPIEEGLALVDRYLTELHDVILRLLELADIDPAQGPAALLPLQQLGSDYEHGRVRWATVRVMLRGYEEGIRGYGVLLGLTLTQESRAERAWNDFQSRYVQDHVPPQFTPNVAEAWQTGLDQLRTSGRADRTRVETYLAQTTAYGLTSH